MMSGISVLSLLFLASFALASPTNPILRKLDDLRYQYAQDDAGQYHLVDLWMTLDNIIDVARYDPSATNVYHLFTRSNPTVSQPLIYGNEALLRDSNYSNNRRTIFLIHGWRDSATAEFNSVLVPALLAASDVNVLVMDWSEGASSVWYPTAQTNSINAATAAAQFIDWLNLMTFSSPIQFHIIGHGLGGHMAGIVGRRMTGTVPYITGLDPSFAGWLNHPDRFHPEDGTYTEVIHTNAGALGYLSDLALVDFYPNGGESMPGCDSHACDHARSFHYFAESVISGGFTGRMCSSVLTAIAQTCFLPLNLEMGGLRPKNGFVGIYSLATNAAPPFSQG